MNAFFEIATILGIATGLGFVGMKLRQPLLIMFLVAGIVVGPSAFGIVQSHKKIELLAQIGISLLLFIVGLKLDLKLVKTVGPVALATGIGQIVFTAVIGFFLSLLLGIAVLPSIYISVALTFSSTIIIVKLLSDKKEIDSLHGQIALGFLIVQDIAAILALVGLTTLRASASHSFVQASFWILLQGTGLLLAILALMRWGLPWLVKRMASSQELLVLFSITWAVALGATSEWIGFSKEVGAFLAGFSLASTDFRDSIGSRLVSVRDFLLLFFFIDLGARLNWASASSQITEAAIFSLFVLIGNPLIVIAIMGWMGYRRRTGFLAGLTVAQISEFSLIVAALGLSLGHINQATMGLITVVGVITIFLSTYMILFSGALYAYFSGILKFFERKHPYREEAMDSAEQGSVPEVLIVGLGRYGSRLADALLQRGRRWMGVDFDPEHLERWKGKGVLVQYGDAADPEVLETWPLSKIRWVISTIRSKALNEEFVHHLKVFGYKGKIALAVESEEEGRYVEGLGVQVIFRPFVDAAEKAAEILVQAIDRRDAAEGRE